MRSLPFGRRTGLSDARGFGTAAPLRKILGEPADLLTESIKPPIPSVISPFKRLANKPLGAFELAYRAGPDSSLGFTDQHKLRVQTEQADRQMRVRAAPKFVLGVGKVSGWDWIRSERRRRPNLPQGFLGSVALARPLEERGVHAQQLDMPILTVDALAAESAKTAMLGPANVPVSYSSDNLTVQLEEPAKSPDPKRPDSFQWGYLIAAVIVAFVVLRKA